MAYQMMAERDNEKAQSRSVSLFIAAAKARVWASEGWNVVVTDDAGKQFTPAELDVLCAPKQRKPPPAAAKADQPSRDAGDIARLERVKSPAAASLADTWESLESAVSRS